MTQDTSGVTPDPGTPPAPGTSPGLSNNSAQGGSGGVNPWAVGAGVVYGGSAILNYINGQKTNDENSAEAARNRAFAADEAETSRQYDQAKTVWQATHGYQNAVDDMKRAGLNPQMLAYKGFGAESGSGGGGSAASAPGNAIHTNAMAPAVSSALQGAQLVNDIRSADADIALKQAQAVTQAAQATQANAAAAQMTEDTYQTTMKRSKTAAEATRDASQATIDKNYQYNRNLGWFLGQGANLWNSAKSAVEKSNIYKNFQTYLPQIKKDIRESDLYKKVMP